MQVLFGLEYAHAIPYIKEALTSESRELHGSKSEFEIHYADVFSSIIKPEKVEMIKGELEVSVNQNNEDFTGKTGRKYRMGGLVWCLPEEHKMEDYLLFWIGSNNSAFANFVLTFNSSEIGKGFHNMYPIKLCHKFLLMCIYIYMHILFLIFNSLSL